MSQYQTDRDNPVPTWNGQASTFEKFKDDCYIHEMATAAQNKDTIVARLVQKAADGQEWKDLGMKMLKELAPKKKEAEDKWASLVPEEREQAKLSLR